MSLTGLKTSFEMVRKSDRPFRRIVTSALHWLNNRSLRETHIGHSMSESVSLGKSIFLLHARLCSFQSVKQRNSVPALFDQKTQNLYTHDQTHL